MVWMTLIATTQSHFVQQKYKTLSNGQGITGQLLGRYSEQSQYDCSIRYVDLNNRTVTGKIFRAVTV